MKTGVAELWDDFAQFGTNFQWFQPPIHPPSMQRRMKTNQAIDTNAQTLISQTLKGITYIIYNNTKVKPFSLNIST
ncbi:hypothetical protein LC607_30220 [Nostoc sp. CHAB 5824]|nr:hypothetical protein [Nostoc sp. CHAB 5824]